MAAAGGDVHQDIHGADSTPDQGSLGGLVRAHRARLGLTQEELAERAELSERTLRNLEGGRIRRPYPDTIRRLADALQLTDRHRDQLEATARGITAELGSEGTGPSLLPPSVTDFTGRQEEVASVLELLATDGLQEGPHTVVISALAGKPGIGKTTLAVHVAHRLRDRFSDGQLYVNLQGAQPQPLEPASVLVRFLRALGLDGSSIPDDLEERAERYRMLLADRRMLVVLDNAAGEAQVRPLMPGSPTCGVLVTSRARLTGLEGVQLLDLDVLPPQAAVELLARVAGPARITAEPEPAAAIVGYCGRLPLAIRIAGARLAALPAWSLARLAERLADERRRLDELTAGDLEVRASIALSYRALSEQQQRVFRRLGLLEAPDFPAWVAAALLDLQPSRGEELVDGLVDAQLLEVAGEDAAGQLRYRFHDLLRVYARERAAAEDPSHDQDAALARAWGGWLALAEAADRRLPSPTVGVAHGAAPRWPSTAPHGDGGAASVAPADPLAWFEAERVALVTAVAQAANRGVEELAWDLAGLLLGFLSVRNHLDDWRWTHEVALAAAERGGDRRGQAYMLRGLGQFSIECDDLQTASARLEQALALFDTLDDRYGWAHTLLTCGYVDRLRGHPERALACFQRALEALTACGDQLGQAYARWNFGLAYHEQGRLVDARVNLEQALHGFQATGHRHFEAWVLRSLGLLDQHEGQPEPARACLQAALRLLTSLGDRFGQALVLEGLGELASDRAQGKGLLAEALRLSRELNNRFAEARVLWSLGGLHHADGQLQEAEQCLQAALGIWQELGIPLWQARTLDRLGAVQADAGQLQAAQAAWRQALVLFDQLGAPEAQAVAQRLPSVVAGDPAQ
jgi:tetratricopeptide (TPR) repeat protein/transcriptional regulator with XRE-family HTH domain